MCRSDGTVPAFFKKTSYLRQKDLKLFVGLTWRVINGYKKNLPRAHIEITEAYTAFGVCP
jgi:hypothetical protein